MKIVQQYLEDFVRHRPEPDCKYAEQFVFYHGEDYTLFPDQKAYIQRYGRKGACFHNALKLTQRYPDDLFYTEGFGSIPLDGQPHLVFGVHAWTVTRDGKVVDPTWKQGCEYFGVAFDLDYVLKIKARPGRLSVVDNFLDLHALWSGEHTDWRPKWAKDKLPRSGFVPYPSRKVS